MRYRHGGFTSNDAEFGLRGFSRLRVRSTRGRPQFDRVTLATNFFIIASTQADIAARYNAIFAQLKLDGVDSGFLHNDGSQSVLWLSNSGSRNGVQVIQGPDLTPRDGADYATGHEGAFAVSAEYDVTDQDQLLDYQESVTIQGNAGPIEVPIITDTKPTLFVATSVYSPVFMVQQGFATGLDVWPLANPPLWANSNNVRLINPAQAVTHDAPRTNGDDKFEYTIRWQYRFQADGPQSGLPLIR